ncbi:MULTISPECIES: hypothetical protein [Priestia]|jgi:hypothetical protein|nr:MULTISPECIES: hypothetical protein [Priestia]SDD36709.1 hypothetical protein SAMN04487777_103540 [Priestia aryabhattai B8W22]MBX9967390.1 hypothetical protein [Priestia aryabhattai]MCM3252276.1 hypothetical protein [Priestia aryabhattai]PFW73212.1 hypothetical protein COL23_21130 [Priestia aryabhattai]UYP10101.1 hypothetical protein OIJ04_10965 [Priestia megaterium]
MKEQMSNLFHQLKQSVSDVSDKLYDKVHTLQSSPGVSVFELYEWIKENPSTSVQKQTLLGISYSFYTLHADGVFFYMETKYDYLLYMTIYSPTRHYFTYHSYRDSLSTVTPLTFPITKQ